MTNTVDATLTERGSRYGAFTGHAEVAQGLKAYYRNELAKRNKTLDADMYEALDMIMHKIGRIVNGDPNYSDHWHDISGYSQLVDQRLQGKVL